MLNRILIRIKVLQVLYAYYQNGDGSLKVAENEMLFSLQKSYDLYHYLLLLIVDVTNLHDRILDNKKHKYTPTWEDLNPNMRFVENRFAKQLSRNRELLKHVEEHKISWINDADFLKDVLDTILASEEYGRYMNKTESSYEGDKALWRDIFKNHICESEMVSGYLEDKSIYWNDDVDIIESFVLKTLRQFTEEEAEFQPLLPMFTDEDVRLFPIQLLRKAILSGEEYRERISRHAQNWETERLANMDVYIMQLAIAELLSFPSIPISVTLNEYIDMAKYYSTPKSGIFINGILDSIVNELKKEGRLLKD
ncbi:N utilization substance protein B [Bacteroidia bacterium]|nr:N utilization substance protein B [Bacteroidia bacterium]